MNIFMVDMHSTIPLSFGRTFQRLGWTLQLAGHSFNHDERCKVHYGRKWNQAEIDAEIKLPNVKAVEVDDLFHNPPDIYMIMCAEQQADQLRIWDRLNLSSIAPNKGKLVFYSGNDNTGLYYDGNYCHHLLAADISSYASFKAQGKHVIYYFPWVDYDTFSYGGPCDEPVFRSYINEYQRLFPQAYDVAVQCSQMFPYLTWEVIQGRPKHETISLMHSSMATLHIKNLEGYGFAITESLACGRPVILYRAWTHGRSYVNWCIEGESALYFGDRNEYAQKISRLINDADYRHKLQEQSAAAVRRVVNNEEQCANLKKFIEEIP